MMLKKTYVKYSIYLKSSVEVDTMTYIFFNYKERENRHLSPNT